MPRTLILVRHPEVHDDVRALCYGARDVALSPAGAAAIPTIAERVLAEGAPTHIVHSGLSRAGRLAEAIAARAGLTATVDARLRERDFGSWELRSWEAIYAETGDAMMGMVDAPATWAPEGGETTFAVRDRVLAWHADLPAAGHVIAVAHGGTIAALRGSLADQPLPSWLELIPDYGAHVRLDA